MAVGRGIEFPQAGIVLKPAANFVFGVKDGQFGEKGNATNVRVLNWVK
jgi:hypothetical protein